MTSLHTRNPAFGAAGLRRALLGSAAIAAMAGFSGTAQAQDSENDEAEAADNGNVIIVQARRQDESLQDVPVTVTAIGGDVLDRYQIDEVADVQSRVPSLTIQVGGSGAGGSINLRGVGSSAISASFDSAVAFDIDGVQVSTARLVQAGFFDAQQIDVLKGPQSLFFGKSASAGVFALRSADPTSTWEVGGKASYEFEEEGYTVGGYISGPLTDTLGIRVAAQYNDVDEFQLVQPGTPAAIDPRGQTNFVGRVTLDWEPTDRFDANFKFSYVRHENDGANQLRDIDCGADGLADPVIFAFGNAIIPSNADCNTGDSLFPQVDSDPITTGSLAPPTNRGAQEFLDRNGLAFGITDIFFGRLEFNLALSDFLTLTSTTGYLDFASLDRDAFSFVGVGEAVPLDPTAPLAPALAAINGPGVPLGLGSNLADNQTRQLTQELRIASDYDGLFNFQIGAFYETREIEFNTAEQAFNVPLAFGAATGGGVGFDYQREHATDTEAFSVFGSVDLALTDRLNITAGLRWTTESKSNTISIPFINPIISGLDLDGDGNADFVTSGFVSAPINFSDDNFSPEVALTYELADDINFFAAFKTGFKSGGIDNSALPGVGLAGIGNPDINPATGNTFDEDATSSLIFESEETIGGEIGIKSQFNNRAITINVTAYHYIFDNLQVQLFDGAAVQFVTFNAGELTTSGIDVDWNWRTPVDGLSLSGTLAYLDSRFTDTFIGLDGSDLDGRAAPRAPDFAGNFAVDWFIPLGESLELGLSGNAAYSSSYFTGQNFLVGDLSQDSFVTLDAGISIGDADGVWQLSLIGTNLTDEQIVTSSGPRPFVPVGGDDQTVTLNRGRQVAAEVSFRF
ncbi:MAG: TonB-dependent receptor [Erythrobacter sp.]